MKHHTMRILFVLASISASFGMQERLLTSAGAEESCGAMVQVIQQLRDWFPECVIEYCDYGSTGQNGERPPTPPPIGVTESPPIPGDTTTTTTVTPTTTGAPGATPSTVHEVQVGTYLPSWFVYRKHYMGVEEIGITGGVSVDPLSASSEYSFWAKDLEPLASKLTHVYYAFWNVNADCHIEDADTDASWYGAAQSPAWIVLRIDACRGLMNDLMALKTQFPHLRLLLSIGGQKYSKYFSKCVSTASGINTMYQSAGQRFNEMDSNWGKENAIWNGFDFDWEYPESDKGLHPDHGPDDWNNFNLLIKHFRDSAASEGRHHMDLTSAIGVGETLDKLVLKPDQAKLFCDSLQHVNLKTYDIHGIWDPTTGHNAPFCTDTRQGNPSLQMNVMSAVDKFAAAGCNIQKIHLGLPTHSPAWTLIDGGPHENGLFVKASDTDAYVGWSTFSDAIDDLVPQGHITFWDMKESLARYHDLNLYTYDCPENLGVTVPIRHVYSANKKVFASFDDEEVVFKKIQWAKKRGMGGFFLGDAQSDKHGTLLDVATIAWGSLPTHSATGTYTCHDSAKPNYGMNPISGQLIPKTCQMTNRSLIFLPQQTSCAALKLETENICGASGAHVLGGLRSGETECVNFCNDAWGPGNVVPSAYDVLYYACAGEEY